MDISVTENPNITDDASQSFEERARQIEQLNEIDVQNMNEKQKSIFSDFAQLNRKNIIHLITASQENPTSLAILLFFIENMDKMNAIVCSYQVLSEQLGYSRATITRSIKYLKDKGFICIYKSGNANVYVVNNELVWTTAGNKIKYCKFPANVFLTATEQKTIDQNTKLKYTFEKVLNETEN